MKVIERVRYHFFFRPLPQWNWPILTLIQNFGTIIRLVLKGKSFTRASYNRLFGVAYGCANPNFYISKGQLYYRYVVDQRIRPLDRVGNQIFRKMHNSIFKREFGKIVVQGKFQTIESEIFSGSSNSLANLEKPIEKILTQLKKSGDRPILIAIYHNHPSLDYLVEEKGDLKGRFYPLGDSDIQCARIVAQKYKAKVEIFAISPSQWAYSYLV